MQKKIALFGGSFDPPHFGHINLALEIKEAKGLDEVLFCPAFINPNKLDNSQSSSTTHRLRMLKLALDGLPHFKVCDIEAKREGVSYTVETLEALQIKNKNCQLFLILGLDNIENFSKWREPDKILSLATPLVGLRDTPILNKSLDYYPQFKKGLVKTRLLEISSTEIRERISEKLYIRHLLPSKVVDYIYHHHLY